MNITKTLLALTTLTASLAWAQMPADHGTMPMQQMSGHEMPMAAAMTSGEVRKIDKEAGKVTLKHGDIKHMDMPGMTMVFAVKDKSQLDAVKVGDQVQFMVTNDNGKMVVTDIQPAK